MEAGSLTAARGGPWASARQRPARFARRRSYQGRVRHPARPGLVLADRFPDSGGEWILLLAIYALTVAAMVPTEARPAALATVVLANIVAS